MRHWRCKPVQILNLSHDSLQSEKRFTNHLLSVDKPLLFHRYISKPQLSLNSDNYLIEVFNVFERSAMNAVLITPRRVVLALAAAGLMGIGSIGAMEISRSQAVALPHQVESAQPSPDIALPNFAKITAMRGPAVVNVSVSGMTKTSYGGMADSSPMPRSGSSQGIDPSDPLFDFYRRFMQPGGPGVQPRDVPMHAQGSGFIVSSDGLILTNAHVVQDAKDVTVKLTDRREFTAKVLGADPKTDVAVLKIDAKDLPVLPLGNARDLQVGEWVLAIGSPFGFENSVSAGVVSAKGRSLPDDSFVPFIQTDVAVNPGNSGGPLFNSRGEVVGINSQIYSRTGGYQGLSFAIPIEIASKVKDQIVATGQASHARLGVTIQEVNQSLADSFKLNKPEGALVSGVESGGPADKAGLKSGDIILKISGQPVLTSGDLPAFIGSASPGTTVILDVWRQGKPEVLSAKLGDASDKQIKTSTRSASPGEGKLGLALRPLQPQEKRAAGVDDGLLIEDAVGAAAVAGIQPGDVLISVNGIPIRSVDQARSVVSKSPKSVALLIQRDGNQMFVPIRIG